MREAALAVLSRHLRKGEDNAEDQAAALADRLREVAATQQQRPPFRSYKSVLCSSLDEALAEAGYTATMDDQETLLSILRRIEPHPEVPAALDRLRALPACHHQQHR